MWYSQFFLKGKIGFFGFSSAVFGFIFVNISSFFHQSLGSSINSSFNDLAGAFSLSGLTCKRLYVSSTERELKTKKRTNIYTCFE